MPFILALTAIFGSIGFVKVLSNKSERLAVVSCLASVAYGISDLPSIHQELQSLKNTNWHHVEPVIFSSAVAQSTKALDCGNSEFSHKGIKDRHNQPLQLFLRKDTNTFFIRVVSLGKDGKLNSKDDRAYTYQKSFQSFEIERLTKIYSKSDLQQARGSLLKILEVTNGRDLTDSERSLIYSRLYGLEKFSGNSSLATDCYIKAKSFLSNSLVKQYENNDNSKEIVKKQL